LKSQNQTNFQITALNNYPEKVSLSEVRFPDR
jgi:hypothetical protein